MHALLYEPNRVGGHVLPQLRCGVKYLISRGDKVTVVGRDSRLSGLESLASRVRFLLLGEYPDPSGLPLAARVLGRDLTHVPQLRRLLGLAQDLRVDLLHIRTASRLVIPLLLALISRPRIAKGRTFQVYLTISSRRHFDLSIAATPWEHAYLRLSRWVLHSLKARGLVDQVLVYDGRTQEILTSLAPVRRIQFPMETEFLTPDRPLDARLQLGLDETFPVALCFGSMTRAKGLDLLLEAASGLRVQILVAGELSSSVQAGVQRLLRNLQPPARVSFSDGFVPESELGTYFGAADFSVFPYRGELYEREGADASAYLLAVCAQTPLVVSDSGDMGRMVRDFGLGLTFPSGDVQGLRNALKRMLDIHADCKLQAMANFERLSKQSDWRYAEAAVYEGIPSTVLAT